MSRRLRAEAVLVGFLALCLVLVSVGARAPAEKELVLCGEADVLCQNDFEALRNGGGPAVPTFGTGVAGTGAAGNSAAAASPAATAVVEERRRSLLGTLVDIILGKGRTAASASGIRAHQQQQQHQQQPGVASRDIVEAQLSTIEFVTDQFTQT